MYVLHLCLPSDSANKYLKVKANFMSISVTREIQLFLNYITTVKVINCTSQVSYHLASVYAVCIIGLLLSCQVRRLKNVFPSFGVEPTSTHIYPKRPQGFLLRITLIVFCFLLILNCSAMHQKQLMATKSWLDTFLFIFQDKTTKIAYFKIYNPKLKVFLQIGSYLI